MVEAGVLDEQRLDVGMLVGGETSNRPAIAVEAKPSAANNNAFARITSRCAAVPDLAKHSSISR